MRNPRWTALAVVALSAPLLAYAQTAPTNTVDSAASASASSGDSHEAPPEEAKPVKPEGVTIPISIMGGLRVGAAINAGKNSPNNDPTNDANAAIGGIDLAIEVGATVFDHFYGGFLLDGTFFISPGSTTKSVSSLLFGTEVGYLTNADGLGGFFGLGVGYRVFFVGDAIGGSNGYKGPDFLATAAIHLKLGTLVRILPRVDFAVGPSSSTAGDFVHAIIVIGFSAWLTDEIWPPKRRHPHPL